MKSENPTPEKLTAHPHLRDERPLISLAALREA